MRLGCEPISKRTRTTSASGRGLEHAKSSAVRPRRGPRGAYGYGEAIVEVGEEAEEEEDARVLCGEEGGLSSTVVGLDDAESDSVITAATAEVGMDTPGINDKVEERKLKPDKTVAPTIRFMSQWFTCRATTELSSPRLAAS